MVISRVISRARRQREVFYGSERLPVATSCLADDRTSGKGDSAEGAIVLPVTWGHGITEKGDDQDWANNPAGSAGDCGNGDTNGVMFGKGGCRTCMRALSVQGGFVTRARTHGIWTTPRARSETTLTDPTSLVSRAKFLPFPTTFTINDLFN